MIVGRREPVRGRDVPEGRHHRDRARDDRRRLHRQGPRRSSARSRAMRTVSHDPTCRATVELADGGAHHRGRAAVGVPAPGAEVRRRDRARVLRRRGRRRPWCSTAGRRCSPRSRRDPLALDGQLDWVTKLGAARRVRRPRRARVGRPEARRCSTCSTTTSGPSGRSTSAWCGRARSSAWSTEADVIEAMTEPPATHAGILPGRVPRALARRRGRGQLGQPDPRRRRRPVAADPDDGAAAGNEGARRAVVRRGGEPRRTGRPADRQCRREEVAQCPSGSESRRQAPEERVEEEVDVAAPAKQGEELKEELDDLLDEIDSVLEANAEEFVKIYVQKGGE